MKTLIHIGVELIVIGGITFWLNRNINAADLRITELQKQVTALEETVKKQSEIILKHEELLNQIINYIQSPQQQTQSQPAVRRPVAGPSARVPTRSQAPPPQRAAQPVQTHVPVQQAQVPKVVPQAVVEQPDIPPEQLDQLLEQELQNMAPSEVEIEAEDADSEGIEIECQGDICVLKETPKVNVKVAPKTAKKKVTQRRNVQART